MTKSLLEKKRAISKPLCINVNETAKTFLLAQKAINDLSLTGEAGGKAALIAEYAARRRPYKTLLYVVCDLDRADTYRGPYCAYMFAAYAITFRTLIHSTKKRCPISTRMPIPIFLLSCG